MSRLPEWSVHQHYPPGYHMTCWIADALQGLGHTVDFNDPRLLDVEGFALNGKVVAYWLDNRIPGNRERQDPVARRLLDEGHIVCHAQRLDAERVGGRWLPLAVTPGFDRPKNGVQKTHDVAFVGYLNDRERRGFMQRVMERVFVRIASGVFHEEAHRVYHEAKVGLNVPALIGSGIDYDVNQRVFEIMASGTVLVTNYNPDLHALGIRSGVNCLTYSTLDECVNAIQLLLADDTLRAQLATNAYRLVMERHTWTHRAKELAAWAT